MFERLFIYLFFFSNIEVKKKNNIKQFEIKIYITLELKHVPR